MQAIGENDVLMGRGGATNNNAGNIRFRDIVASKQLLYLDCKKKEKKAIAEDCVSNVHESGGRFLSRDWSTGAWVEVSFKKAVQKTSQCLREQLDVRNRRIRNSTNVVDTEKLRKRQKVVQGKVVVAAEAMTQPVTTKASPGAMVSLAKKRDGGGDVVPELQEEMPSSASKFHFCLPPVSKNDCDHLVEV